MEHDNLEGRSLVIRSDSEYALNAICSGYCNWYPNGYNRRNRRNPHWDLIVEIRELMSNFEDVNFYHCNAHRQNSCEENYEADQAAHSAKFDGPGHGYIDEFGDQCFIE